MVVNLGSRKIQVPTYNGNIFHTRLCDQFFNWGYSNKLALFTYDINALIGVPGNDLPGGE